MKGKLHLFASTVASLALAQVSNAAVITFTDLNTNLTAANTVSGSGGGTTASTGAASSGTFKYSVIYSGFDFDGDTLADSFSFDVTVAGRSGTTGVTNSGPGTSSVTTLGTTVENVVIQTGTQPDSWVVGNIRFTTGETLVFSVDNIQTTNTDGAFTLNAIFDGFTGGRLGRYNNNGQPAGVFGLGTGLNGYTGDSNGVLAGGPQPILYISSSYPTNDGSANFGVHNVDFGFTVNAVAIPEPSSTLLLGAGALGLLLRRRRA
ncbi:MAG: PEP-CTERM sorting domain-containing protein [Luteolibacter sp.]